MVRQAQSHEACASFVFSSSACEQHTRPLPFAPLDVTLLRALLPASVHNNTWLARCSSPYKL